MDMISELHPGAFQFRSDQFEGIPVAENLSQQGFQNFVADYRLRPYIQEEGELDLARAVRFVRSHSDEYGADGKDTAVMGFSTGGILAGEMRQNGPCASYKASASIDESLKKLGTDYIDLMLIHQPFRYSGF